MKIFINELILEVIYEGDSQPNNTLRIEANHLSLFVMRFLRDESIVNYNIKHYLVAENKKTLRNILKRDFKLIKAAGGVVRNKSNQIVVIYRNGKWDIPKGKVEPDENIREVKEECGIKQLEIQDKLLSTYHIYMDKDKLILKKTNWYNMFSNQTANFSPQMEEGITKVKCVSPSFLVKPDIKTYKSIKEVISKLNFGA